MIYSKSRLSMLAGVLLGFLILAGCEGSVKSSPSRQKVADAARQYQQAADNNADAQFDAQERALKNARYRAIQAELEQSLANAKAKGAANPTLDLAAEYDRLYALAAFRRSQFDEAQKQFRALHERNIATNRAGRDKALNYLEPPPPVDTTAATNATAGAGPNATLIDPSADTAPK